MPIVFKDDNNIYQVQPPASPEQLLERVCNHWLKTILHVLEAAGDNVMTYNEIKKEVQPTSEKMFAHALIELDAYGFIRKKHDPTKPKARSNDYALTEQGRSLLAVINQLQLWADNNHKNIEETTIGWNQDRKLNNSIR